MDDELYFEMVCKYIKIWSRVIEEETYGRGRSSSKDETTKVSSSLVAQGASSVDESTDTVALESGTDKRGAPGNGSAAGLLGLDKLLGGAGLLGALVGLAKERAHDGDFDAVVEGGAQGNGRGLNGREVYIAGKRVSRSFKPRWFA